MTLQVEEVGPLRYYYSNKKYNVSWVDGSNGDLVTFKQYQVREMQISVRWLHTLCAQYYLPADAATVALAAQNVTTVNVPLLAVLSNPVADLLISIFLSPNITSDLFITRTTGEVLWGYNDTLLEVMHFFDSNFSAFYPGIQVSNDLTLFFWL